MKSLTIFSLAILALTVGCDDAPTQNNGYGNHQISQAVPVQYENNGDNQNPLQQGSYPQTSQSQNNGGDQIVIHTVINPKTGQPSCYIPVPASWEAIAGAQPGQPGTKGPNGLTITSFPPQSYTYANDQFTNQVYQSSGMQVMAPVGIEGVLSQQLIPQGRQMGMTLVNQYPLPTVAANDASYANKLSGSASQDIHQAAGSDWADSQGNRTFVVLHYYELRSPGLVNWGYNVDMLKVQPSDFERAKNQLIYAMSNKTFNQNEINNFKNQLANELNKQKANNDHFQAMMKINRDGAAKRAENNRQTNEYVTNTYKATNEYRTRSSEVLQEQTDNYLNDVNVVVSPYDGKEYQVESGSQTYWINEKGQYIKSDDVLYDPNNYEDYQGVWQKAPNKVYK